MNKKVEVSNQRIYCISQANVVCFTMDFDNYSEWSITSTLFSSEYFFSVKITDTERTGNQT